MLRFSGKFPATGISSMKRQRVILILCCLYVLILVVVFSPIFSKDPTTTFDSDVVKRIRKRAVPDLYPEFISQESASGRIWLMTVVSSPVTNFAERSAIRETWGSITGIDGHQFRLVFVLEDAEMEYPPAVIRNLTIESKTFGDLLARKDERVPAARTSVGNLSGKISALRTGLEWMDSTCKDVRKMLRTADSYFINMIGLYWSVLNKDMAEKHRRALVCIAYAGSPNSTKRSLHVSEVRPCSEKVFVFLKPSLESFSSLLLAVDNGSRTGLSERASDVDVVDMAFATANSTSQMVHCIERYKTDCKLLVATAEPSEMKALWSHY